MPLKWMFATSVVFWAIQDGTCLCNEVLVKSVVINMLKKFCNLIIIIQCVANLSFNDENFSGFNSELGVSLRLNYCYAMDYIIYILPAYDDWLYHLRLLAYFF